MSDLQTVYNLERSGSQIAGRGDQSLQPQQRARRLYDQAGERPWWRSIGAWLSRQPLTMYDLTEIKENCASLQHRYEGRQRVALDQVRGSSTPGRCRDFDSDLRPLKSCDATRWMGVATVRMQGRNLPPVSLIRIRDLYFVEDGHHRLSVARALGDEFIEAEVTEWQVAGPLPWLDYPQRPVRHQVGAASKVEI